MKKYVIIVAGGSGERMKSKIPKQFLTLFDKPILMRTIQVFHNSVPDAKIILALPKNHQKFWMNLCQKHAFNIPHKLVLGGKKRFDSVKNALQKIQKNGFVAIHDGVRPLVNKKVILDCFKLAEKHKTAVPVIPLENSIRQKINQGNKSVNRKEFLLVQTPQCFEAKLIIRAYNQSYNDKFTDDATVVEETGQSIYLINGNKENIKITTPHDIKIAHSFLQKV